MLKKLELATEDANEVVLAKHVVQVTKTHGIVVMAFQYRMTGGELTPASVAIRDHKKVTGGWQLRSDQREPVGVASALAKAILELTAP